ncbi:MULTISPECIES: nucleoside triphosphate pyrophosphatase [unclassified Thioalkalivibrio]|uniref:Maf family protein n=1 Tax=unclassified Thioalkalivibrio TaxID=2621013 RepID=UPI0003185C62|nr:MULTISPECIES: Maf family protein [unclassified Thioalkalivibrio]
MREIVLASTSPYRAQLLQRLHLPFTTAAPQVDETRLPDEDAAALVRRLAEAKARAVTGGTHPDALIIGSDQSASHGGRILGKPGNAERAREQLASLSGGTVTFHTGLCLLDASSGEARVEDVEYTVTFRRLSDAEIRAYVALDNPVDCAGSFKSEGLGVSLFERMEGSDPTALVGLPLIRLCHWLREAGIAMPPTEER